MNCWWPKTPGEKRNPGTVSKPKRQALSSSNYRCESLNKESSLQFKLSGMGICYKTKLNQILFIRLLYLIQNLPDSVAALSERCVSAASWTDTASTKQFLKKKKCQFPTQMTGENMNVKYLNVCHPAWVIGFLPRWTILMRTRAGERMPRISSLIEQPGGKEDIGCS